MTKLICVDRHCIIDYVNLKKIFNSPQSQNILTLYFFYYLQKKEGRTNLTTKYILKKLPTFNKTTLSETIKLLEKMQLISSEGISIINPDYDSIFVPITE